MIEASGLTVNDKPQCLLGDKAICPKHNGTFALVSGGNSAALYNGRPMVFGPAQLACDCRVASSCPEQYSRN